MWKRLSKKLIILNKGDDFEHCQKLPLCKTNGATLANIKSHRKRAGRGASQM